MRDQEYVVYPGGTNHYSLKDANARAKLVSREEGSAYVQNRYTLKKMSRWYNGRREASNPARLTKAQRKEEAHKRATERRVANALANYLRKLNPGKKLIGVGQQKLKGGAVKVRPIFAKKKGAR